MIRAAGAVALALAAACGGGGAAPRRHVIEISAFQYQPQTVEARAGDTIVWINRDVVPHTATDRGSGWDTGSMAAGAQASVVVERPGSYAYVCAFHPNMGATLAVR
ncbi:MAG TPA: cupredoxin family copper-binding protein [Longimicrobium sp.]|nr:cupredoxin family copper-binding protein [Longimicrobium sp.]